MNDSSQGGVMSGNPSKAVIQGPDLEGRGSRLSPHSGHSRVVDFDPMNDCFHDSGHSVLGCLMSHMNLRQARIPATNIVGTRTESTGEEYALS
jgi:hypothetical protein